MSAEQVSAEEQTIIESYPAAYPLRIYLQRHEDCVDLECKELHEGTTWCADKVHVADVEYVRGDVYYQAVADRDQYRQQLTEAQQLAMRQASEIRRLYRRAGDGL